MKDSIKDIIGRLKAVELANLHLEKLEENLSELRSRSAQLEKLITRYYQDVDALDKLSIKALYHKLRGNRTDELTIQKQRYLDITLEYTENQKLIEQINFEMQVIARKNDSVHSLKEQLRSEIINFTEKIGDVNLFHLKKIIEKSQINLGLIKEMEEAIDQGVIVNRKLNSILKFLKDKAQKLFNEFKDKSIFLKVQTSSIERYQDRIISLKHSLIKYEVEITDVYRLILKDNSYQSFHISELLDDYREHLINDLFEDKPLNKSYFFIKGLKEQIMSVTKVLRSDLRKIRSEQNELEEKEYELLEKLKSYEV